MINDMNRKFMIISDKELVETSGGIVITTTTAIGIGIATGAIVTYNYFKNKK